MALFHLEAEAWKRGVILRDAGVRAKEREAWSNTAAMADYQRVYKREHERVAVLCEGLDVEGREAVLDAFEAGLAGQPWGAWKGVEA